MKFCSDIHVMKVFTYIPHFIIVGLSQTFYSDIDGSHGTCIPFGENVLTLVVKKTCSGPHRVHTHTGPKCTHAHTTHKRAVVGERWVIRLFTRAGSHSHVSVANSACICSGPSATTECTRCHNVCHATVHVRPMVVPSASLGIITWDQKTLVALLELKSINTVLTNHNSSTEERS